MRLDVSVHLIVLAAAAAAAPVAAQPRASGSASAEAGMPSKQVMVESWNRTRDNTLRYLRAVPDSMMGFRTTAGVRTYGEQVVHAVGSDVEIVGSALLGKVPTPPAGSEKAADSKQALLAYVSWGYDRVLAMLNEAPASRLSSDTTLFGSRRAMPRWRWIEGAREHDAFTLGQTVPYLRMNGVTPPEFREF